MVNQHSKGAERWAKAGKPGEAGGTAISWRDMLPSLLLGLLLTGCALPAMEERPSSRALPPEQTRDTALGKAITPLAESHPGLSGVKLLNNPFDAFVARALLARSAEASLDVQYYIWHPDTTGTLLLGSLYRAAERGVRVRLLLDDNGIAGMDEALAVMDRHPSIEVRLFNPFVQRSHRWLGYLTDFRRLNHRMHNKSFTADSQATIIGGRNIADEYFGAGQEALFADLDVLTIGPAAYEVSRDFDRYWSSSAAWPTAQILPPPDSGATARFEQQLQTNLDSAEAADYLGAVKESDLLQKLMSGELQFTWAPITMVSDDPAKALGASDPDARMSRQLTAALDNPRQSVTLVSPYFVPREAGVELFRSLEEQGVEVRILTNSLEANDVALVHAGYSKYRKPLLEAGVELYEMRRLDDTQPQEGNLATGLAGSSASSLHAKTFAVDGETLFVGSFNFDPRSVNLNTELGFVIRSPALARQLEETFSQRVDDSAYTLALDEKGDLLWREHREGNTILHRDEPGTGPLKRTLMFFLSLLPIEVLL